MDKGGLKMTSTLKDHLINYQERFRELKEKQNPLVKSYNSCKRKDSKRNLHDKIMAIEKQMMDLEEERRK